LDWGDKKSIQKKGKETDKTARPILKTDEEKDDIKEMSVRMEDGWSWLSNCAFCWSSILAVFSLPPETLQYSR
jgi:hypothetical protein